MSEYIIAIDQGTTSCRALIFDSQGNAIGGRSKEFTQIYPKSGWVEHDPMEILDVQTWVINKVLEDYDIGVDEIACMGITNQRETVVLWDRHTGKPVYNAIVWQCRRTANICEQLIEEGYEDMIQKKTGLVVDAYFSGSKIGWLLDNVEGVRERAQRGEILAGTMDTWLIWNYTKGAEHVTDYTNASRTMLFNIDELCWDEELLGMFDIPACILPKVQDSSGHFGNIHKDWFGREIPITGVAGDQQSALFGQLCFDKGMAKNTYGTGCFLLMNTGEERIESKNRLLTTIACGLDGKVCYALEGSIFIAGAAVQWLRDEMGILKTAAQSEDLAVKVDDTNGTYVVPAFTGLGAPYWDMYARGTIVGISRGTNRNHIVRATLESLAYQTRDVLEAMEADSGIYLKELRVDGGASENNFLMQFQSDILDVPVIRPKYIETTALGAAYLAGIGQGIWKDKEDIVQARDQEEKFYPSMDEKTRIEKYRNWKRAVKRSSGWIEQD